MAGEHLMSEMEAAIAVAEKFAPDESIRTKFYQGFLGSLLGQVVLMMGAVLIYLCLTVSIFTLLGKNVAQIREVAGPTLFWGVIIAPFALIFLFNILPTLWRTYREHRLRKDAFLGASGFAPGYFRLFPYGADDAAQFHRLDGSDQEVIRWVLRSDDPILYLSGPSGSGKSSLIEAALVPAITQKGYLVVQARLFDDPVAQVLTALRQAFEDLPEAPQAALSAAAERTHASQKTLLLVLDQFEEFLILHQAETQAAFRNLLDSLVKQPIPGLRLLLCLRSDYQALIFRDELPRAIPNRNWFQLAPYRRGDAESFLQGGGRQLSPQAVTGIFRGLDRIEETRGLYRPITLNMIGLVLERMGQQLEGDPQLLIQAYLRQSITSGDARDFAIPLLSTMITDAGTKEPRKAADIATATGLATWQVDATLAVLAERGLVRALDTKTWEVSHDFLARLLGQMIGRLRPRFNHRAAPFIGYAALAGWSLVLTISIPFALSVYQAQLRSRIQSEFRGIFANSPNGTLKGHHLFFLDAKQNEIKSISNLINDLDYEPTIFLHNPEISDFTALNTIRNPINLSLPDSNFSDGKLKQLSLLINLTHLDLSSNNITDLKSLSGLKNLTSINLSGNNITNIKPIESLIKLTNLNLSNNNITDIKSISGLKHLTNLDIGNYNLNDNNVNSFFLNIITSYLQTIRINNADRSSAIMDLLRKIGIGNNVTDLTPIAGLKNLTILELTGNNVSDLKAISGLKKLTKINLSYNHVTDLRPISGLRNLKRLDLNSNDVADLRPLTGLTLTLTDQDGNECKLFRDRLPPPQRCPLPADQKDQMTSTLP